MEFIEMCPGAVPEAAEHSTAEMFGIGNASFALCKYEAGRELSDQDLASLGRAIDLIGFPEPEDPEHPTHDEMFLRLIYRDTLTAILPPEPGTTETEAQTEERIRPIVDRVVAVLHGVAEGVEMPKDEVGMSIDFLHKTHDAIHSGWTLRDTDIPTRKLMAQYPF